MEYQAIAKNCSRQNRMVKPFLPHQNAEHNVRALKQNIREMFYIFNGIKDSWICAICVIICPLLFVKY
jgi:hypothetical protein